MQAIIYSGGLVKIVTSSLNHGSVNCLISLCLHRAPIVSKHLFIVPTDAHYYKIIEM